MADYYRVMITCRATMYCKVIIKADSREAAESRALVLAEADEASPNPRELVWVPDYEVGLENIEVDSSSQEV